MGEPPECPTRRGPNVIVNGRVRRSLKPGAAGTLRWLHQYGDALVCVRHREDPAGLRRVVTVELVVATRHVRLARPGVRARVRYAVQVAPEDSALQRQLYAIGGRWHAEEGVWYVSGTALREADLLDLVPYCREPKRRRSASRQAQAATRRGSSRPREILRRKKP